jgi:hypothetical protein
MKLLVYFPNWMCFPRLIDVYSDNRDKNNSAEKMAFELNNYNENCNDYKVIDNVQFVGIDRGANSDSDLRMFYELFGSYDEHILV